ncbi:potassium transporter TrkA, partial [bacterium]|nr:potassium transporter TrkA [bacterium]
ELYLKPAAGYVTPGVEVNFYTVVESACRRHEIAVGYRRAADMNSAEKKYGVVLNPKKSELVAFSASDCIIVLAEFV